MTQANIYIHQLRDKSNKLFLLNLYKIAACYPKSVTRISELLFFGEKVMGIPGRPVEFVGKITLSITQNAKMKT
jgi:hypothetical protein